MDQAAPEVAIVLSEPNPPMPDRIMYFRSRFQRLVRTGSQLVTFPFCSIALLTMGRLRNVPVDMYPAPYKGLTLDKSTKATPQKLEKAASCQRGKCSHERQWFRLAHFTNKGHRV